MSSPLLHSADDFHRQIGSQSQPTATLLGLIHIVDKFQGGYIDVVVVNKCVHDNFLLLTSDVSSWVSQTMRITVNATRAFFCLDYILRAAEVYERMLMIWVTNHEEEVPWLQVD